jgi:hypothetical protein
MKKSSQRLPRYQRASKPPSMRLTARDRRILEAIHAYDGMLGFSQIKRLFFTGKSQTEERLKLLYQHKYVDRPSREQRMRLPEMIYWLDKAGAETVASLNSVPLGEFRWRKNPRWFQVDHDLAVNDFRLDVVEACQGGSEIILESWIPESEFWSYPDRISYTCNEKTMTRDIRPDGVFIFKTSEHRLRYLLEIDRSTEDNPRFLREKILPGLAYLKSKQYEQRFGHRSGRWLVVTTGERRMRNMLNQARRADTRGLFYFTTYDQVRVETLLYSPIWRRADLEQTVSLLSAA